MNITPQAFNTNDESKPALNKRKNKLDVCLSVCKLIL